MRTDAFDYELPSELIAQRPSERRDGARLLAHSIGADRTEHLAVSDLPERLRPGDLLVVNDARVLPARLFARRASGGAVELLFLAPDAAEPGAWSALVRPAKRLAAGEQLSLVDGAATVTMLARDAGEPTWRVRLEGEDDAHVEALLERHGRMPLPPYVEREADDEDRARYQTVYARRAGAAAAPTAGLHFTPELLERLDARGVRRVALTLFVGAGTFRPVTAEDVAEHRMHSERFELPASVRDAVAEARARGGRIVAVGTTTVRCLESRADADGRLTPGAGSTDLFLVPGSRFRVVDALLTNFHLPRSTLLMLVSAFAGRERVLRLYREAIERRYRFFSYGDAMLLEP